MRRLGIAGIGTIASDYIGLIAAGRVEHVALTALCSRNPDNIRRVCQANGIQVAEFTDYAAMLYDQALLCEGSELPDPAAFARRTAKLMTDGLTKN